jgi:hypothetical protein
MDLRASLTAATRSALIGLSLLAPSVAAQPADSSAKCKSCQLPENCGDRSESCRLECRARVLAIDPRRDACEKNCADANLECMRTGRAPASPKAQTGPSLPPQ